LAGAVDKDKEHQKQISLFASEPSKPLPTTTPVPPPPPLAPRPEPLVRPIGEQIHGDTTHWASLGVEKEFGPPPAEEKSEGFFLEEQAKPAPPARRVASAPRARAPSVPSSKPKGQWGAPPGGSAPPTKVVKPMHAIEIPPTTAT